MAASAAIDLPGERLLLVGGYSPCEASKLLDRSPQSPIILCARTATQAAKASNEPAVVLVGSVEPAASAMSINSLGFFGESVANYDEMPNQNMQGGGAPSLSPVAKSSVDVAHVRINP